MMKTISITEEDDKLIRELRDKTKMTQSKIIVESVKLYSEMLNKKEKELYE